MALVVTVILWKNTTWLTKSLFLPHNQDLNQLNKSGKGLANLVRKPLSTIITFINYP